jgi:hypothetical protein
MFKRTASLGLIPALIVSTVLALAFILPAGAAKLGVLSVVQGCGYPYGDFTPAITSVTPHQGPTSGGTSVTISGNHFLGTTSVTFGGVSAAFTVINDHTIVATSPRHKAGAVNVHVNNPCGTSPTTSRDHFIYTGARCDSAEIDTEQSSPQREGAVVNLLASSTGCPDPEYKFYLKKPGVAWRAVTGWTTATEYDWDTTGARDGVWQIGVLAREQGHTASYEAYSFHTFRILTTCVSARLTASPSSPAAQGTTVTLTGSTQGCNNPLYQFWIKTPTTGFHIVRGYSTSATYSWHTTSLRSGGYQLGVRVKDRLTTHPYDTYAIITYWLGPQFGG